MAESPESNSMTDNRAEIGRHPYRADKEPLTRHLAAIERAAGVEPGVLSFFAIELNGETREVAGAYPSPVPVSQIDRLPDAIMGRSLENTNLYLALAVFRGDLPDGRKGGEADIEKVLGLVLDFDDGRPLEEIAEVLPVRPSFVLETSPLRFQVGYFFSSAAPKERAKALVEKLVALTACDPCSKDLSHVWRIPGTLNWPDARKIKDGRAQEPFDVRLLEGYAYEPVAIETLEALVPVVRATSVPTASVPIATPPASTRTPAVTPLATHIQQMLQTDRGSQGDRSTHFYRVARELIERGLSDAEIADLARQHSSGFGAKFAGRSDLEKEIERIRSKVGQPPSRDPSPYRVLSLDDLSALPPMEYLVDGLLPAGALSMIVGKSGIGKTFFALDLAATIASGANFHGLVSRQGRVIYLCAEGQGGFHKRVRAWEQDRSISIPRSNFGVVLESPLLNDQSNLESLRSVVRKWCDAQGPIDIIFVDTLARSMGGSEIEERDIKSLLAGVKCLMEEFDCAVCLIHHPPKDIADKSEGGLVRGHSSLHAALDAAIYLKREGETGGLRVKILKMKDDEASLDLTMTMESVDLSAVLGLKPNGSPVTSCVLKPMSAATSSVPKAGRPPSDENRATRKVVLDLLDRGPATRRQLVDAVKGALPEPDKAATLVKTVLGSLEREGQIWKLADDRFSLGTFDFSALDLSGVSIEPPDLLQ